MNDFSRVVLEQLAARQWSTEDLAHRTGLAESTFSAFLTGETLAEWPPVRVIEALAGALGIPTAVLVAKAGQACGLVPRGADAVTAALAGISNEELLGEMRVRLARGAAAGGYLCSGDALRKVTALPLSRAC